MYPLKYHPGLEKRWETFSEYQQVAMIANELSRAKNMLQKNDTFEMKQALERAFELVDLTLEHAQKSLRYELLRFREILAMFYIDEKQDIDFIDKLIRTFQSTNAKLFLSLTE